jgi:hypothetical protein
MSYWGAGWRSVQAPRSPKKRGGGGGAARRKNPPHSPRTRRGAPVLTLEAGVYGKNRPTTNIIDRSEMVVSLYIYNARQLSWVSTAMPRGTDFGALTSSDHDERGSTDG